MLKRRIATWGALTICGALMLGMRGGPPTVAQESKELSKEQPQTGEWKKQYWATSLARTVDEDVLSGLYEAVARGEVGWLDVDPKFPIPQLTRGINLILYHVGGNCYIRDDDCARFPSSRPTGDRWGGSERSIDLTDPAVRKVLIEDLVTIVRRGDDIAPEGSIVGIHLDNVHKLDAQGLADMFNDFLAAVELAREQGRISKTRKVGYIAKNIPNRFSQAVDEGLLSAPPLYQINENARLNEKGALDRRSQIASELGQRCSIPVFLKTFGSDVAYERDGDEVQVSKDMARQMAQLPNISGVAWSPDERSYRPTLFAQGAPVRVVPFGSANRCDG